MCPLPVQSSVTVRLGQSMQTWPQELTHMDGGGVQVPKKEGLVDPGVYSTASKGGCEIK